MNIKEIKNQPFFHLVTDDESLARVCRRALQQSVVALDTEFIRIRSYFPKLGLIQLYDGECVALIDPLEIRDFSPFIELLKAPQVLKVLHACYEDLEVFQHYFEQLPEPMADTQIMAAFLKFPASTGLATLIKHYFSLELDKGASRTDWLARPLSETQLRYAAADVWYLLPLYHHMNSELEGTRWKSAAEFDCALLLEKRHQIKPSDSAYLNITNAWRLDAEELMRLQLLAKWRQEEAIKRDLALNFVVKGENLWAAAKHNPVHTSDLLSLGFSTQEVRIHGKKILQLLSKAKRIDAAEYPAPITRLADDPRYKQTLKALQRRLAEITPPDLNSEVIASKRGLESLMKWCWLRRRDKDNLPQLMRGWRREFGESLAALPELQG
ncbi:ribonuclease D [Mesocricetibacter intestinalis]|uniref:Ribonuclease D n=1 Tax=Mesocricetibacter intestinalis TaxID=1521930 RepID=A0A4R6V7L2_9PAST|nr:ribonuclease D [Mesocricetibacter intestinalis]TDQ57336.1 ribonuclease D [Mesocricetibacter intestinalis]